MDLVSGLEHLLFFHILGIIIPIDKYFSEGLKPPTSSGEAVACDAFFSVACDAFFLVACDAFYLDVHFVCAGSCKVSVHGVRLFVFGRL